MTPKWLRIAVVAAALFAAPGASAQLSPKPQTLQDCYLRVALEKSTADLVYLAREICDAVFKPVPRSVAIFDSKTKRCEEWWFDARGRYESETQYCSLEAQGQRAGEWKLACQSTGANKGRYTYVALREADGRYQPIGKLMGHDPGPIFASLAECVEYRAGGRSLVPGP